MLIPISCKQQCTNVFTVCKCSPEKEMHHRKGHERFSHALRVQRRERHVKACRTVQGLQL